jgi:3-oxoacyl-[acyl-carrier-protein] synthase-3
MMQTVGYRHALIVGAETMSAISDYEDRTTCILLGDAAGACVLGPADNEVSGIYDQFLGANGGGAKTIWVPAGGSLEPTTHQTVDQRQHYLKMRGREVYKFAVTKFVEVMTGAIERVGITADDVALIVPHQSNLRIIESAAQKLGLPMDRVAINIDRYGNTSAASIPVAMAEARNDGRIKSGDWVLIAGFGAGLTWGTTLLRL